METETPRRSPYQGASKLTELPCELRDFVPEPGRAVKLDECAHALNKTAFELLDDCERYIDAFQRGKGCAPPPHQCEPGPDRGRELDSRYSAQEGCPPPARDGFIINPRCARGVYRRVTC